MPLELARLPLVAVPSLSVTVAEVEAAAPALPSPRTAPTELRVETDEPSLLFTVSVDDAATPPLPTWSVFAVSVEEVRPFLSSFSVLVVREAVTPSNETWVLSSLEVRSLPFLPIVSVWVVLVVVTPSRPIVRCASRVSIVALPSSKRVVVVVTCISPGSFDSSSCRSTSTCATRSALEFCRTSRAARSTGFDSKSPIDCTSACACATASWASPSFLSTASLAAWTLAREGWFRSSAFSFPASSFCRSWSCDQAA